jgi:hypothetical protein
MRLNVLNVISILFLVMFCLSSCGGGSDGNTTQTPPAISNLQYTPASLIVNTQTNVNWQFDFSDIDGDISTGTYTVFNPSGVQVTTKTISLTIPTGTKMGTQLGTTSNITFLSVGTYTVNMFVTDSVGASSNVLTASFTITP